MNTFSHQVVALTITEFLVFPFLRLELYQKQESHAFSPVIHLCS